MEQEPIARTALDEMVESDQDQMLKAMIPYLPSSGQRFLSVYTKVRELWNTMSLFQSSRRTADLQATGFSGTDPLEMLQDIRKCCGGENRRQIDHITSLMATIQMLQIMYLWVPVAITLIITFIMSKMNVERANEKLLQEQAVKSDMHD